MGQCLLPLVANRTGHSACATLPFDWELALGQCLRKPWSSFLILSGSSRHVPSTPDLELGFFSQSQPVCTAPSDCSFPIAVLMDTLAPLQLPLLLPTPTPPTRPVFRSR